MLMSVLWFYFDLCSMGSWRECVFYSCWVKCSIKTDYNLLVHGIDEFFIIAGILYSCSINCWERSTEVLNCFCLFLLLVKSAFALHTLKLCCLCIHILGLWCLLGGLSLLVLHNPFLSLVISFALKSTLPNFNIATRAFFSSMFAWYTFFILYFQPTYVIEVSFL